MRAAAKALAVALCLAALPLARAADSPPPPPPVVTDAAGAIAIAYAIWYARHPSYRATLESEADWARNMDATLKDGAWHVDTKPPADITTLRGSLHFVIAPGAGRLLDFYYVQG